MGFFLFFLSVLKVTNIFVMHISDVHGVKTTTVCDVTMMYCKEWYMENVPCLMNLEMYTVLLCGTIKSI